MPYFITPEEYENMEQLQQTLYSSMGDSGDERVSGDFAQKTKQNKKKKLFLLILSTFPSQ